MPQYTQANVHCFRTYNLNGNDSIILEITTEIPGNSESNTYTFEANNIKSNTTITGSRLSGKIIHIVLYLTDPNLIIGESYLNETEGKVRFTNVNADYEVSLETIRIQAS